MDKLRSSLGQKGKLDSGWADINRICLT